MSLSKLTQSAKEAPLYPWVLPVSLLALYFIVHFALLDFLAYFGRYGTYYFEALFVLVVLFFYRSRLVFLAKPQWSDAIEALIAFVLGFVTFKIGEAAHIPVPFDLKSPETLLFLLLIGPILEELLFRQSFTQLLKNLRIGEFFVIVLTAFLFCAAHFEAFFKVSDEIKVFVAFQTAYTFMLGLWWGYRNEKRRVVWFTILLHAVYNLGFFSAS